MTSGQSSWKAVGLASLVAVAVSAWLGFAFIAASAPTYDEPVHLASGYLGLAAGVPINYRDHPPLAEMWAALPLLRLPLSTMRQSAQWGRLYNFSDAFLYMNRVPAERMLNAARRWCLVSWCLLLFPAILAWAAEGGILAVAAAAVFCAFCPAILSNFPLVTTDTAAAVFFFLTFWLASRRPGKTAVWIASGAVVGLSLASKFNMIVVPALVIVCLLTEGRLAKKRPLTPGQFGLAVAAAALALAAVYRFSGLPLYWEGLTATLTRLGEGRGSFVHGRYSTTGSWLYFPVALLVKTPLPLLLCGALGLAVKARRPEAGLAWLVLPPAALFLAACSSKTQIGYRHILPIFPFLIVLAACGAAWLWERAAWGKAVTGALALWLIAGVVRAQPDALAYFNELAGGPDGGWKWLADSNLDWGQGLKELGEELHRRGDPPVYLCYFGTADPSSYGIRYLPVGWVTNVDRRDGSLASGAPAPQLLAISVTNLQGVYYAEKSSFWWLKSRTPAFISGHSIFLYDLAGDAAAQAHLRALLGPQAVPAR